MPESLIHLDQQLLLWFNGSDSLFVDRFAEVLTSGLTWIPLYLALFYLVVKNNETMLQIALIVGCSALCILLADGVAEGIVKPLVGRWRPSNDPYFKYMVDVVGNHRGTDYSFFSAHAANTMSIATFYGLLVRNKLFSVSLIVWSLINCWTRMYLGLHYPSDILCGLLWGVIAGTISYVVFHKFYYKVSPKINYISSQYTSTGYSNIDIDIVMLAIVGILAVAVVASMSVF
ncbi:MAG: phosphatase PAP2 family protein [Prevotella sp.]|nr:phosphatase PAP2 family protein [Prevotella sp.]